MLKKIALLLAAAVLCAAFAACTQDADDSGSAASASVQESSDASEAVSENISDTGSSEAGDEDRDVIPPAFTDAKDGALPAVSHKAGEEYDVLGGITVRDNRTADEDISLEISDDGGYDPDTAGTYTLTLTATDEAGNTSEATLEITVTAVTQALTVIIGEDGIEYSLNESGALAYTSSGTAFRASDVIQVMDKDFFVTEYNAHKAEHTNNGGVPFFPNGVLIVTDEDFGIVQLRISAGSDIQVERDGSVSSDISWNNAIDAAAGGGMFKGFIDELDTIISDGGYVIMVGNPGDALCRAYLIKSLFCSTYESGSITADSMDVDIAGARIELAE